MTDTRDPGKKLLQDVVRFKQQRNEARAALSLQAVLLADLQLELIAMRVRGRLLRFEDFHHHIGVGTVLKPDGRVDHRRLDLAVSDLLRRRPELGVSLEKSAPIRYYERDGADSVSGLLQPVESSPVGNTQQSGARA
jgi:hypothetical protein